MDVIHYTTPFFIKNETPPHLFHLFTESPSDVSQLLDKYANDIENAKEFHIANSSPMPSLRSESPAEVIRILRPIIVVSDSDSDEDTPEVDPNVTPAPPQPSATPPPLPP